ncbi:MAG TPA: cell division protein FtsQ/DivIB [Patescibacteria group bacterium]|nr:cell division protein FtsQ/DivIB [Patescibacteria group bacterium]
MSHKFFKTREQLDNIAARVPTGRQERGVKKKKTLLIVILSGLVLAGLAYFFVYSPVFKVERVVIKGINEVDNLNAAQSVVQKYTAGYRVGVLPKNNILFINKEELAKFISESVPVEEVVVKKKLFKTLEIEGEEKLPALIWQEGKQNYYLDKNGWVMAAVAADNIKYNVPIIGRSTTTAVVVGQQIIEASNVDFIGRVLEEMKKELRSWPIKRVEVKDFDNREVNFYTNEGWYLIVDVAGDMTKVLANLNNFLRQEGIDSKKLRYVDLRIADKIFYK